MGAIGYVLLASAAILVTSIVLGSLSHISDDNRIVRALVDEQILNILGVIIAIFLPSAASLHIQFASLEVDLGRDLSKYRDVLKFNCKSLIVLFVMTVTALIIKGDNPSISWLSSVVNGFALLVLLANVLVLIDLTGAMFEVGEASIHKARSGKRGPAAPPSNG